jgi:broad specificity phosphatase PhoE
VTTPTTEIVESNLNNNVYGHERNFEEPPSGWVGRWGPQTFAIPLRESSAGSLPRNFEIYTELPPTAGAAGGSIPSQEPLFPNTPPVVPTGPHRTKVSILFVRHSESCANLLKKVGRPLDQVRYTDPELTSRGVAMARERGGQLATLVPQILGERGPLYYGASVLRRTQQTALNLLAGGAPPAHNKRVYVLPYISEVGAGYDNTPGPRKETVDFLAIDDLGATGAAAKPNVRAFFEWLGGKTREGNFLGLDYTQPRAPEIRMVIVTHAGWMKALAKSFSTVDVRYENLDAAGVTVTYGDDGVIQIPIAWIDSTTNPRSHLPYMGAALSGPACPDNCAGAVVCSGQSGTLCGRLMGLYGQAVAGEPVPWSLIGPLAQDLAIERIYAGSAKMAGLLKSVAERLKQYAPSTGFGRTRDRRNLVGDLREAMEALGCEGAPSGTTEACVAIDELLAIPEGGVNRIPNWQLSLAADKIVNAGNQKLLRNYAKPAGWFTRKKGRAGALRRNLQAMRERAGCPVAVAPTPAPSAIMNLVPRNIQHTPNQRNNLSRASVVSFANNTQLTGFSPPPLSGLTVQPPSATAVVRTKQQKTLTSAPGARRYGGWWRSTRGGARNRRSKKRTTRRRK